jgi:GNAT superfamily N-acetyltransferase
MFSKPCHACGEAIEAEDLGAFGEAGLAHVRAQHPDEVPYPDLAVRNYYEGLARMTGGSDRLDEIGEVEIHPVTEERLDDWLAFFDFDGNVGVPENSACYCLEPHELDPHQPAPELRHWTERREEMIGLLRAGKAFGYLAYVDGRPAGWVSAARRGDTALFRRGDEVDGRTAAVACFVIAPPYRRHALAPRLLDRVLADASARGLDAVEAYPPNFEPPAGRNFRGSRAMYDRAGFTEVKVRSRDIVMRRETGPAGP